MQKVFNGQAVAARRARVGTGTTGRQCVLLRFAQIPANKRKIVLKTALIRGQHKNLIDTKRTLTRQNCVLFYCIGAIFGTNISKYCFKNRAN